MKTARVVLSSFVFLASIVFADPKTGETAPEIPKGVLDSTGKTHTLAEHKGKYVVLEWLNYGCPFVKKHYESGNMQKLQKEFTEKGVVWLSVISSAPGKQGYSTPDQAKKDAEAHKAVATAVLLDTKGEMGKQYGAATTPHMFIIDPKGKLIYKGAIDDKDTTEIKDVAQSKNYVKAALDAAMAGKPVSVASTKPYGCSVKYP